MPIASPLAIAACLSIAASPLIAKAAEASTAAANTPTLAQTIQAQDQALFDAFNRCADPAQLQAHAAYFSEDTEFYHDNSGVTWNRADMLKNTAAHACGKYTRQLLPGTLRVEPVKGFGAVAMGSHRFCDMAGTACAGEADFVMVWRQQAGQWVVTRTLSLGHRPAATGGTAAVATPSAPASAVTPNTPPAKPPFSPDLAALDRLIKAQRVESVSMALLRDGRPVSATAVGLARQGVPATVNTLYNIASLAKPISAEVALQLVARGEIGLDEALSSHWTDPDLAQDARARLLTPELVLSHRTGLPNWRQGRLRFERAPGEAFGYSGEGFEALARFIEAKTSRRLDDWAERLVFGPLGMRQTSYTGQPWFGDRIALPHDAQGQALPPDIRERAIASDDVFSTPSDYAAFMASLMAERPNALRQRQRSVVTDRRAQLCHALPAAACPSEAGFGLGWETFLIQGRRYLMHTGSDRGTFTFAYFSPDTREGAVFFMNSDRGASVVLPLLRMTGADEGFVAWLERMAGGH